MTILKVASFPDELLLSVIFSEKTLLGASMKVRGLVGWCVLVADAGTIGGGAAL